MTRTSTPRRVLVRALPVACAIIAGGLAAAGPTAGAAGCNVKRVSGTIHVTNLTIVLCKRYVITGTFKIIASGSVTIDKRLELTPGAGLTIKAKGPIVVNAPIGPEPRSGSTAHAAQGSLCPSSAIRLISEVFGIDVNDPVSGAPGGTDTVGDGCPGESIVISATFGGVDINASVDGGDGGPGKEDKKTFPGFLGRCDSRGRYRTVFGGDGGQGGKVTLVGNRDDLFGGEVTGAGFVHAGNGGSGGSVLDLGESGGPDQAGMDVRTVPGPGGDGGDALLENGSTTVPFGHAGAGGAPGNASTTAGGGGPPNCNGGDTFIRVAAGGKRGRGSLDPTKKTPWSRVYVSGGNAFVGPPPSDPGGAGGLVNIYGGTPVRGANEDLHAFVQSLSITHAGDGGDGSNGCPEDPGGSGGKGGVLESLESMHFGERGQIRVVSLPDFDREVTGSFNGGDGGDGVPPGGAGPAGRDRASHSGLVILNSFKPGTPGAGCPAPEPVEETGFNVLPEPEGIPYYAAAGPTGSDVLIGDLHTSTVAAANSGTGTLDTSIGSSGVLPLPSGFPSGASVTGVTFGGGDIYASFFDSSNQTIYVGSWNAQGQLNTNFGNGGAVVIVPDSSHDWTAASWPLLVDGKLVIGAQNQDAPGVTLIPLSSSSGALGTPVSTPAPSGIDLVSLNTIVLGPDGNLYVVGSGYTGSTDDVFYGIFNPSTLGMVSQSAFSDGDSATGAALTFSPTTAYLGVNSTVGTLTGTDLFSAALGTTSGLAKTSIPVAVSGADQGVFGLQFSTSAGVIAGVYDEQNDVSTTWLDAFLSAGGWGSPVQIGENFARGNALIPESGGGVAVGTQVSGSTANAFFATYKP